MTQTLGRVRAPELRGAGGWINTDRPLSLAALRGHVVVLDFWTFCCINCLRVIEELRPLEARFGTALVVVGVHSPKFPHESDHTAVVQAVRRHRIHHPVLDDPGLETWQAYGARAWPTLVVIDQDGYVVASAAGEGNARALGETIAALLENRPVPEQPAFSLPSAPSSGMLSFPGKVAAHPDGRRIAVGDTGNDRVLLCTLDGEVLRSVDGLHQPQGVRFDGDRLLLCDTVAGSLLAVPLDAGDATPLAAGLRSPWDVVRIDNSTLAVAEAGSHRIVAVPSDGGVAQPLAGTGVEGLRDGPALQAHLAQPSGLALLGDGGLAIADSEVSALRVLRGGDVTTLVGRGLFDWGSSDGDRDTARLQHPLGVAALPGGGIAVADSFNSVLRIWQDGSLRTLATDLQLDEPGGIDVTPGCSLLVADTGNHRVLVVDPDSGRCRVVPLGAARAEALRGSPGGSLRLDTRVELDGEDLDQSQGPPVRIRVTAEPETLLADGVRTWVLEDVPLAVDVVLGSSGEGTLTVDVIAATCHDDVCTVKRRTTTHPLRVG